MEFSRTVVSKSFSGLLCVRTVRLGVKCRWTFRKSLSLRQWNLLKPIKSGGVQGLVVIFQLLSL